MAKIKIQVTQDDIQEGTINAYKCPIARALTRETGAKVIVGGMHAWLHFLDDKFKIDLPSNAQKFICEYDMGNHVEQFTFQLDDKNLMYVGKVI